MNKATALFIVQAYTEREILERVPAFLEAVPQAVEYMLSHEISDDQTFLKFHAFGLINKDCSVLRPLFDEHMVSVLMSSGASQISIEDIPEY
jgi:hypothetical protein